MKIYKLKKPLNINGINYIEGDIINDEYYNEYSIDYDKFPFEDNTYFEPLNSENDIVFTYNLDLFNKEPNWYYDIDTRIVYHLIDSNESYYYLWDFYSKTVIKLNKSVNLMPSNYGYYYLDLKSNIRVDVKELYNEYSDYDLEWLKKTCFIFKTAESAKKAKEYFENKYTEINSNKLEVNLNQFFKDYLNKMNLSNDYSLNDFEETLSKTILKISENYKDD